MANNDNNQPQATYTKAPTPQGAGPGNSGAGNTGSGNAANTPQQPPSSSNNKPSSNIKLKTVLAIIGIVLFLIVASVGVFISQRQQEVSGPVAPTAPTSQPSADERESDSCQIQFTVAPPSGVANCTGKEAFIMDNGEEIVLENGFSLSRGTEFYYRATVEASELTAGNVTFTDQLNENLEFVEDPLNTTGLEVDTQAGTTTVTASLGQMQPSQTEEIVFKVRITEAAEVGDVNNVAEITTANTSNNTTSCNFQANITSQGEAACIAKEAYRLTEAEEVGEVIAANDEVSPGERFLYRITVEAIDQTANEVFVVDSLPEPLAFLESNISETNVSGNQVTSDLGILGDNETVTVDYTVEVNEDATTSEFTNTAQILTGETDETPSECAIALGTPTTACNSECTTDDQCPSNLACENNRCRLPSNPSNEQCQPAEVSLQCNNTCNPDNNECPSGLECLSVDSEFRCRLAINPTSASCTPADEPQCNDSCTTNADCPDNHVCYESDSGDFCRLETNLTDSQCRPLEEPTPTPISAPGCNENCTTNADCSNADHICYTTADGSNKCRLAENVESTTCSAPATAQPDLPEELPETGPVEWGKWLKAGLVTLGLGTILLLLL